MRRGLKLELELLELQVSALSWNGIPDEKGIETVLSSDSRPRLFLRWNGIPDEKGIETYL